MIKPWVIGADASESAHQQVVFAWAAMAAEWGIEPALAWVQGKIKHPRDYVGKMRTWQQKPNALVFLRWMFAIPNGGSRGSDERSRSIAGAKMKAEGQKAGVFDFFLPLAFMYQDSFSHGLFVEMKRPGQIKAVSENQKQFLTAANSLNYSTCICDSWQLAIQMIVSYIDTVHYPTMGDHFRPKAVR